MFFKSYRLFCRKAVPEAEQEPNMRPSDRKAVTQPGASKHGSMAEIGKAAGDELERM